MPSHNFRDLTGERFGPFTVQERTDNTEGGQSTWIVRCNECGHRFQQLGQHLLRKRRTGRSPMCPSCGNSWRRHYERRDLTGERFGNLSVSHKSRDQNNSHLGVWTCRCDCGSKPFDVSGIRLLSGELKSCGCLQWGAKVDDLSGQRFGSLVVIRRCDDSERRHSRWLCRCACGRTIETDGWSLRKGRTTSCGCKRGYWWRDEHYRSRWEIYFAMILVIASIDFDYEPKAFDVSVRDKRHTYTPDFRLNDSMGWIEIKGRQRELGMQKFSFFSGDVDRSKMILKDDLEGICGTTTGEMSSIANNDGFDALFIHLRRINPDVRDILRRLSETCGWHVESG